MKNNCVARLIIIGASGHGKVAAECAEAMGVFSEIVFLDQRYPELRALAHWQVIGKGEDDIADYITSETQFFVAIGVNLIRAKVFHRLKSQAAQVATLRHPTAYISEYATIDEGTLVCANATINPFSRIGANCIVNTSASVDHDCAIADHVHIAPGSHLAGTVQVGELSFIGIGSQIIANINIGKQVTVGAGGTVIRDLPDRVTAVGCPARVIS